MKTYLVGGAVRDKLLKRKLSDRDWVVVGATPDEMISQGYKQVGTDFPVFLHPQSKEEYALARTERKTAPGYTGFQVFAAPDVSLEDDLRRRDLTINAMAEDDNGNIIDPYGGLKDLKHRKLRHVSEAFSEDPVRILRVARFAARYHQYGFTVARSTHQLMSSMVENGEAKALVSERVWQETKKALMEPFPSRFLEVLRDCGALAVLFPEIEAMYGVPQTAKYHPEIDCGVHLHLALDRAAKLYDDPLVMFAVLTHDLGKGITPEHVLPSHRGHESAGLPLIKALCKRLKVPTRYLKLALVVGEWHLLCHTAFELKASSIIKLFGRCDAWRQPEQLERFFCACQADAQGRLGMSENPYPQADFLRACFAAAGRIDTKELLAKGLIGEALGQEIHKARIRAIAPIVKAGAQAL